MATHALTSFRTLFAVAVITIAGTSALAATERSAEALPRDPVGDMIQECFAFGGELHNFTFVGPNTGRLIGWYVCEYDYGIHECFDYPGQPPGCEIKVDPDFEEGAEDDDWCGILCTDEDPDPASGQPPGSLHGIPMAEVTTSSHQTFEASPSWYSGHSMSTAGKYASW